MQSTKQRFYLQERKAYGNTIAEFGPTLFVLLLLFAFPLIDLLGIAISAATVILATNCAVGSAASQATYTSALQSAISAESSFLQSGFAKFANIIATGGYQNSGIDLYTQVTTYGTTNPALVGPNTPVPPPINVTSQMYEYAAIGHFQIAPLINMSGVPLVNQIPGLAQPVQMSFRAVKMVEHPQGLSFDAPSSGNYSGQLPVFARTPIITANQTTTTVAANSPIWRTPDIYNQIAAAGKTVVSTTIFTVYGNLNWQSPGITIHPGQTVWLDSNAVGSWGVSSLLSDANGSALLNGSVNEYNSVTAVALIGYVGTPPAVNMGMAAANQSDPNMFFVGDTLTNYQLPNTGGLSFMCNTFANTTGIVTGSQMVRIIITN